MTTDIVIIGIKDIISLYGLSQKEAYKIVKVKGCPVLPRDDGAPYRLIQDEFEAWLRGRRA